MRVVRRQTKKWAASVFYQIAPFSCYQTGWPQFSLNEPRIILNMSPVKSYRWVLHENPGIAFRSRQVSAKVLGIDERQIIGNMRG